MITEQIIYFYRVLEIEPGASFGIVKKAYRDLVKVWHPDRFHSDPNLQHKAQEKLKNINAAYAAILEYLEKINAESEPKTASSQKQGQAESGIEFYRVGQAFYFGEGKPINHSEAAKFLTKSALLGCVEAQALLGCMYYRGEGVSKDLSIAAKWWIEAAEHGQSYAQDCLGCLYKDNFGSNVFSKIVKYTTDWDVGDSKIESYKWFNLAVTNGYHRARIGMEDISLCMTQNQINEARLRASKLYPAYPNISTDQAIHEWFVFYLAETKKTGTRAKWHSEIASYLRDYPQLEVDIIRQAALLLENEFFGKKAQQASAFFQTVGSSWKNVFGKKRSSMDCARLIAYTMKLEWDAYSPEYICKKENLLNFLWLKIYAGK